MKTGMNGRAERILAACLDGRPWSAADVAALASGTGAEALFNVVAEGLADRFEPSLCNAYAEIFSYAFAQGEPSLDAGGLVARYRRVRCVQPYRGRPRTVFVLSRVTLGADVAVTSVIVDAVKRRFPAAEIVLAGSRKSWELFACDPRIRHLPVAYRKGTMQERLEPWRELRDALVEPDSLVIDPDSRLTQLGLLPVCPEDRYRFFESRGYGGAGDDPLPVLAARWVRETFGIEDARPFLAPGPPPFQSDIAVSFGVGENPAKRLPDPFEPELLRLLCSTGRGVVVDKGAGAEEAARVEAAIAGSAARTFEGSFASFAAIVQQSRLYAGYDSAGQHVAAACGVPLISIFAGFPAPRMFHRWRPTGPGSIDVVRVEQPDTAAVIERVRSVLLSTGLHSRR